LWGREQNAQRWTIFRINNYSHNTLTVDNQLQLVKGYAKIDQSSDKPGFMNAISDLSTVYKEQLAEVKRGVAIVDQEFAVIRDEVVAANKPTTIRWTMMTSANPELGKNSITLTRDGHKLVLRVNSPAIVSMKTWPTEPTTNYDAPNPGTTLVGFELQLQPNQKQTIQVLLVPGSTGEKNIKFDKPLINWK
jgi:hypothetical protein